MSIWSAASALIDDLVATGSWARREVSACDYGLLDRGGPSACLLIIQPVQATLSEDGYGTQYSTWTIRIEAYIRNTADPAEVLGRIWQIHDTIPPAVRSGSNLNTAARSGLVTTVTNPDFALENRDNMLYFPVFFDVTVKEAQ